MNSLKKSAFALFVVALLITGQDRLLAYGLGDLCQQYSGWTVCEEDGTTKFNAVLPTEGPECYDVNPGFCQWDFWDACDDFCSSRDGVSANSYCYAYGQSTCEGYCECEPSEYCESHPQDCQAWCCFHPNHPWCNDFLFEQCY
jgi:hypothetical protein